MSPSDTSTRGILRTERKPSQNCYRASLRRGPNIPKSAGRARCPRDFPSSSPTTPRGGTVPPYPHPPKPELRTYYLIDFPAKHGILAPFCRKSEPVFRAALPPSRPVLTPSITHQGESGRERVEAVRGGGNPSQSVKGVRAGGCRYFYHSRSGEGGRGYF